MKKHCARALHKCTREIHALGFVNQEKINCSAYRIAICKKGKKDDLHKAVISVYVSTLSTRENIFLLGILDTRNKEYVFQAINQ